MSEENIEYLENEKVLDMTAGDRGSSSLKEIVEQNKRELLGDRKKKKIELTIGNIEASKKIEANKLLKKKEDMSAVEEALKDYKEFIKKAKPKANAKSGTVPVIESSVLKEVLNGRLAKLKKDFKIMNKKKLKGVRWGEADILAYEELQEDIKEVEKKLYALKASKSKEEKKEE